MGGIWSPAISRGHPGSQQQCARVRAGSRAGQPPTIARLLKSPLPKAGLALNCLEVWVWRVGLPLLSSFPPAWPSPPREGPAGPTDPLPPKDCAMSGRDLVTNPRSWRGEEVNHQQCCAPGRGQKRSWLGPVTISCFWLRLPWPRRHG